MKKNIAILLLGVFLLLGCSDDIVFTNSDAEVSTDTNTTDTNTTDTNTTDTNTTDTNTTDKTLLTLVKEEKAKEWYVRIIAEDTSNNIQSSNAQLGQLDREDTVVEHSLKAIAPFDSLYIDIVFKDPVGLNAGEYKSNFHLAGEAQDTWEFTVKASDTNATIILGWRGLYILNPYTDSQDRVRYHEFRSLTNPLLVGMTLLDTDTDTVIPIRSNGAINEYVFNMNGLTERTFKWILNDIPVVEQFKSFNKIVSSTTSNEVNLQKLQIQVLRKDAKSKPAQLTQKRLNSIEQREPPIFKVLVK